MYSTIRWSIASGAFVARATFFILSILWRTINYWLVKTELYYFARGFLQFPETIPTSIPALSRIDYPRDRIRAPPGPNIHLSEKSRTFPLRSFFFYFLFYSTIRNESWISYLFADMLLHLWLGCGFLENQAVLGKYKMFKVECIIIYETFFFFYFLEWCSWQF